MNREAMIIMIEKKCEGDTQLIEAFKKMCNCWKASKDNDDIIYQSYVAILTHKKA